MTNSSQLFIYLVLIFIPKDDAKEDEVSNRRYIPSVWSSPQIIRKLTPTFRRKLRPAAQWAEDNSNYDKTFIIR